MKKKIIYIILFTANILSAQTKYYTKLGIISFEASVPSFEQVNAVNKGVTSILNTATGEIAVLALVRGFKFKVALMEEHFNENYAESTKFPKATFTGKIDDLSIDNLAIESKSFNLKGDLTFHGKTIPINPQLLISKNKSTLHLKSIFRLNPEEFDIKIPKIVRKKVAKTVEVTFDFILVPKN